MSKRPDFEAISYMGRIQAACTIIKCGLSLLGINGGVVALGDREFDNLFSAGLEQDGPDRLICNAVVFKRRLK